MGVPFDVEQRWSELFEPLTDEQRRSVLDTLAMDWRAGWVPNRRDVADFIEYTRGLIDEAEYFRRSDDHGNDDNDDDDADSLTGDTAPSDRQALSWRMSHWAESDRFTIPDDALIVLGPGEAELLGLDEDDLAGTPGVIVADAERIRRVVEGIHSIEMAGLRVGAETAADAEEYARGLIDSDELVRRARVRYGLE